MTRSMFSAGPRRVLTIDFGGTHINCGLAHGEQLVDNIALECPSTTLLQPLLPAITANLHILLERHRVPAGELAGIALGFCGIVDSRANRIASTNGKYEDAPGIDLIGWALAEFGVPLQMENDARLALLGETFVGAARNEKDVVLFTLGTGIGGVAMIDGKPLSGRHGQAGLLGGHFPVRIHGRPCTCGGRGCAESEAGGWALPGVCRDWPGFAQSTLAVADLNFKNIFEHAAAGDSVAIQVRDHCLRVWALAAVAAVHAFDPTLILYGGGVMRSAEIILPYIQQVVANETWTPWGTVKVRAAALGENAALLGGVPLLRNAGIFCGSN
ncbi:MAG: ROK family protein [Acidobacteriota bacterium]|nr:ROK family protein [Acidobacteriota bacterium]